MNELSKQGASDGKRLGTFSFCENYAYRKLYFKKCARGKCDALGGDHSKASSILSALRYKMLFKGVPFCALYTACASCMLDVILINYMSLTNNTELHLNS